jgi:alkanesulfonate monooxygenase
LGGEQKCAIRVDLVARATEEEAFRDIRIGFENVTDETRRQTRGPTDSVGASRQAALRPSEAKHWEDLRIARNLWGGFNLLRGGPALGIVGSYEQCAEQLDELIRRGADAFILAGTPHLEEAYRVGEEVLPLLGQSAPAVLQAAE